MNSNGNEFDVRVKVPEDIDIETTGLRSGEKLYEELIADNEDCLQTYHEKILLAKPKEYKTDETIFKIKEICNANEAGNVDHVIRLVKNLIPEFKSNNSMFEHLDN